MEGIFSEPSTINHEPSTFRSTINHQPSMKTESNASVFTYIEVKHALCEACRLAVPDVWHGDNITHYRNGVAIPCKAAVWRRHPIYGVPQSRDKS
jgi:hypothetical protein